MIMTLMDDPGVPLDAMFAARDRYCKQLGCTVEDLGDDALDAIAAALEGAAPGLRKQGMVAVIDAMRKSLGSFRSESTGSPLVRAAKEQLIQDLGNALDIILATA
jgi:hypothetical protein